jgi:FKBP-type peptidyl-prolyl cis-trans isomerase
VQLKSGLVYVDTKVGQGDEVQQGRRVSMRYKGTLVDGTALP